MSERARDARRLSSILTAATGVYVRVVYVRDVRRYHVKWTGGPDESSLYAIARENAAEVPLLVIDDLRWHRAEPAPDRPQLGR